MLQELLYREMLEEMRKCIQKEDVKAGLPFEHGRGYDIEHIFIYWQQFRLKIDNLNKYITSLDYDIAARLPWGDITISSEEGFTKDMPITRFWTAPKVAFESARDRWNKQFNISLISEGEYLCYFTTSTSTEIKIEMEGATEAQVCPSPASTLIMLQTRAKDTLKLETLKRNDFAVEHYRTVEDALGLKDTIPTTKRKRLLYKIRKLFKR